LRERFEEDEIDIDSDDDKLGAQLSSIKWGIDSRGPTKIESTDDCANEVCHHWIGLMLWQSPSLAWRKLRQWRIPVPALR
jgi:hypothetical protein